MATTKAYEIGDFGVNLVVTSAGEITALDIDTDVVDEGSNNLYYTDARSRAAISVSGNLTYNSSTGVLGFTMPSTIASLSNHDTDDLAEGTSNLYYTSGRARAALSGGTGVSYSSSTGVIALAASGVTNGTYGGSTSIPSITVDAYGRITSVSTNAVAGVDGVSYNTSTGAFTVETATGTDYSANITLAPFDTDDLAEGSSKLYYTDARARAAISVSGSLSYNSTSGVLSYTTPTTIASLSNHDTDDLNEGVSNLYFTDARANSAITKATIDALNVDADTLDGISSASFLRSDADDTMSGNLTVSGSTSLDGAVVINESGADVDFRIESDTNANAFFLDGATGNVGIGTNGPITKLDVADDFGVGSGTAKLRITTKAQGAFGGSSYLEFAYRDYGNVPDTNILASIQSVATVSTPTNVGGDLRFTTKALGGTTTTSPVERMRINSSGNVGIGTTSPSVPLHVNTSGTSMARFVGGNDGNLYITNDSANVVTLQAASGDALSFNTNGGNERMRIDSSGTLILKGPDDNALQFYESGNEIARVGPNSGKLNFLVGTTTTPRMTIDSGGNVGIGDNTLSNGNSHNRFVRISDTGSGARSALEIEGNTANAHSGIWFKNNGTNANVIASRGAGDLTFLYGASSTEAMRIDSSGNVGIGTSSSLHKLSIEGTADNKNSEFRLTATGVASGYLGANSNGLNIGTDTAGIVFKTGVTGGNSVGATGTERMRIDSSGQFMVGTNAGNAYGAGGGHFTGTIIQGASGLYQQQLSFSSGNTIQSAVLGVGYSALNLNPLGGNVGIGTTSPTSTLHIKNQSQTSDGDRSATQTISGQDSIQFEIPNSFAAAELNYGSICWTSSTSRRRAMISAVSENTDGDYLGLSFYTQGTDGSGDMYESVRMNHGGGMKFYYNGGSLVGSISVTTSGTTYNTTSDRRLKENIIPITDGKDKLLAMKPCTFTFKADDDKKLTHGFIAQEMQEVIPEAVSGNPDAEEMMSMDYGRITPVIVAALQDALKEIEELKTRINELEAK